MHRKIFYFSEKSNIVEMMTYKRFQATHQYEREIIITTME